MLQHVTKAQVLNLVFCGMDLIIGVFEIGLNHKSRGVSCLRSRSVVTASIPAFG